MPDPLPSPPPTPETPTQDPPPAASIVLQGGANEGDAAELVRLRQEAAELREVKKAREIRLAELEDENRRLKTPPPPPAAPEKAAWMSGSTFFD
jgi:hypothetical protein